jgi:hypothetical protein
VAGGPTGPGCRWNSCFGTYRIKAGRADDGSVDHRGWLIALTGLAAGIAISVSGHLGESVPAVLIPLALIMLMIGINVTGRRSLEQKVPRLVQEVNSVLDSSVIFLGTADLQASAGLRA